MTNLEHSPTNLSSPYSLARAIESSRAPMTPQLIPYLALFRQENGPFKPCTFGNMLSFGILTLSMKMDPVSEALSASLFLIAGVSRPSVFYKSVKSIRELLKSALLSLLKAYGLDQESSDFFVPRTLCPDNTQICHRRIRYPCLGAV
jgi:hypothetical protein